MERTDRDDGGTISPARPGVAAALARGLARPHVAVAVFVSIAVLVGWAWLGAMVAAMLAGTDMATLGPGMGIFNRLNGLSDLSPETRAALTLLCGPIGAAWRPLDWAGVFAMWVAMVMAMMVPTAVPVFRAYADLGAERQRAGERIASPVFLGFGYLAIWIGFSAVATLAQGLLTQARLLSPAGLPASEVLAGTTIFAAGLYQFTPLKWACLARCRTPHPFFADRWTNRAAGVFRQGLAQGLDCLGCCWALMVVMFAVGVMNVVWIVALGAIMTIEKLSPSPWVSRIVGLVFLAWGAGLVAASPVGVALLSRL
jgi:predicted metal-binding membrane protein